MMNKILNGALLYVLDIKDNKLSTGKAVILNWTLYV